MKEDQSGRLLIIGLDGATFDLIRPWAAAGHLPNIARLLAEGVSAPLRSVPNMNSAPAWSSFATGLNPGQHGIFYFYEQVPGTYTKRYLNASFRRGATFWRLLSEAGHRVGVINVPLTYPAEPVNGFMLAGLDTPGVDSPGFSHPPELAARLRAEVGEYTIEPGIPGYMKGGRRDEAAARIFEAIDRRLACARYLMAREPWDLFLLVFTATDAAQHFFWKDMDPSHPEHDPAEAARFGEVIFRTYRRLDEVVGELCAAAPDATVMLMSDHGGGFNQRGAEYLNDWLADLGLLSWLSQRQSTPSARELLIRFLGWVYRQVDRRLPRETKQRLVRLLPGVRERMETAMAFEGIDWPRTRAYAFGARDDILINLAGREPQGTVQPGREYEELRDFIIDRLYRTRDVASGEPVVEVAQRREEVYAGNRVERAPDILIRWRTDRLIRGLYIPQEGQPRPSVPPLSPSLNNGGHRPHGILILAGPEIRRGLILPEASIMDLAPTILYRFDLPLPGEMDGRVLTDAFVPAYVAGRPVRAAEGEAHLSGLDGVDYDEEDAAVIEERLRGMGYVE